MGKAVLFRSDERFSSFKRAIEEKGIECVVLDFSTRKWIDFDYGSVAFVVYYPSFKYSSTHPLSLYEVQDNLSHIKAMYPDLVMYPDPEIIRYYNDKYRQWLFLESRGYPTPRTCPLFTEECMCEAEEMFGYPMVVKNRYGAGGTSVFKVSNRKELRRYYNLSTLNLFNLSSVRHLASMLASRRFYYLLIKVRRMAYPFLSPPLLAQEFIRMDRDIKTVVGDYKVVEAHWRLQAHEDQWKVNIDGGGIGQWSKVPEEVLALSERLARDLRARWLNIDLIPAGEGYVITEFSPVWHHYAYREKPEFVYKDDYNIETPLEVSLDLERMIVDSLVRACGIESSPR